MFSKRHGICMFVCATLLHTSWEVGTIKMRAGLSREEKRRRNVGEQRMDREMCDEGVRIERIF